MARTIPFPFRDHHDSSVERSVDPSLIEYLIGEFELALWDSDKADTEEDLCYYEGQMSAYADALIHLLGVPIEEWNAWCAPSSPGAGG